MVSIDLFFIHFCTYFRALTWPDLPSMLLTLPVVMFWPSSSSSYPTSPFSKVSVSYSFHCYYWISISSTHTHTLTHYFWALTSLWYSFHVSYYLHCYSWTTSSFSSPPHTQRNTCKQTHTPFLSSHFLSLMFPCFLLLNLLLLLTHAELQTHTHIHDSTFHPWLEGMPAGREVGSRS